MQACSVRAVKKREGKKERVRKRGSEERGPRSERLSGPLEAPEADNEAPR